MNHTDRAMLYLIVAMVGTSIGASEWCVYLAAITSGFYTVVGVAGFVWRAKEGGGK